MRVKQSDNQSGFTYVEVLIATLIVAVALAPAIDALRSGVFSSMVAQDLSSIQYRMLSAMEQTLTKDRSELNSLAAAANGHANPTSLSDAAGTELRRLVYIGFYDLDDLDGDGDPFTIQDSNADADNNPYTGTGASISTYWISVRIENSGYEMATLSDPVLAAAYY